MVMPLEKSKSKPDSDTTLALVVWLQTTGRIIAKFARKQQKLAIMQRDWSFHVVLIKI